MEMLKEIDNSAAVDYLTQKKRAKISRSFFFEGKKKKNVYFYQLQGEMIYTVKHLEILFIFHHYCQIQFSPKIMSYLSYKWICDSHCN